MKRHSCLAVLPVMVAGLGLAPSGARADSAPALSPVSTTWLDSRLVDLGFQDPLVDPPLQTAHVRVLLPSGYATSTKTYPVVFLLHGAGDTAAAWTSNDDGQESLEAFTAGQDVVIVMPDAGQNADAGWYSDWYEAGPSGKPQWERFHIGQVIPYVESHYRVRTDRGGWVVAGLSMGGFGAMSYAARHPDLFAAAFSFSGFLDTDGLPYLEPAALAALNSRNGTPTSAVWGDYPSQEVRWRGHNPADLVGNLHDVSPLWLTTGQGVPGGPAPDDGDAGGLATESAVYSTNQTFDVKARQAGVAHTFQPYPQGGHNWWHWQDDLHRAWPLIMRTFSTLHTAPASFDYESMETSFGVWGWSLASRRDVTEFLTMQAAGVSGLTLTGSGAVDVVTPPAYVPQRAYGLHVSGATASITPHTAIADASGRLHFAVTLGPSHTLQQYTPQERVAEASDPAYWETAQVRITPHGSPKATTTTASEGAAAAVTSLPDTSAGAVRDSAAGAAAFAMLATVGAARRLSRRRNRSLGA